ncbi:aminoacyl-tRNA hydrolase [Labilibaculum filiforme]|uniref:Peptidyl-tRNA hydrolase n=1 Tax=Labilibaculum filiforme TaxID=1940526 RepID=A0A2N3I6K6_9BACT|nr:aminoacyl-tRNA hydrolase [Labilibaculum filiforme]PKQ65936.1 aminoacyl-tRNA hydrolase [Labilibaculum filiforme]
MIQFLKKLFGQTKQLPQENNIEMKYLIVGLGNIGAEYANTRHNIGFRILDALAETAKIEFKEARYGAVAEYKFKGRTFILVKPNTYMNLSGKSVNYWLQKEKIPVENMMVLVDDLALPFETLRLRPKGSDAGHNGLKHINEILGHQNYNRLRFGIGSDFGRGQQVDYVLGEWTPEELEKLPELYKICINMIKGMSTIGIQRTMTAYNTKKSGN